MQPADAINDARLPVRPRKDRRGVDLISDILPFGRLWFIQWFPS
jgi:hypothetical protein